MSRVTHTHTTEQVRILRVALIQAISVQIVLDHPAPPSDEISKTILDLYLDLGGNPQGYADGIVLTTAAIRHAFL
jgi:hypothetical protein